MLLVLRSLVAAASGMVDAGEWGQSLLLGLLLEVEPELALYMRRWGENAWITNPKGGVGLN